MPVKARPPYPKFNTPYRTRSSAARYEHACVADKRGGGLGLGGGRAALWFCRPERTGMICAGRRSLRIVRPEGGERQEMWQWTAGVLTRRP